MEKTCRKCGLTKSIDAFHKNGLPGMYKPDCKKCRNKSGRENVHLLGPVTEKACSICGEIKQADEFNVANARRCGLSSQCRECFTRLYSRRYLDRCKAYRRTMSGRYSGMKGSAKYRGVPVLITLDEYVEIVSCAVCTYCQFELDPSGGGLDRIDNTRGYESGNVVPCCGVCNLTRSDLWTHEDMLVLGPHLRLLRLSRKDALVIDFQRKTLKEVV